MQYIACVQRQCRTQTWKTHRTSLSAQTCAWCIACALRAQLARCAVIFYYLFLKFFLINRPRSSNFLAHTYVLSRHLALTYTLSYKDNKHVNTSNTSITLILWILIDLQQVFTEGSMIALLECHYSLRPKQHWYNSEDS